MTHRIVILGAGVMGSAMTLPGAHGGSRVDLVGTHLDEEIVRSVTGNGLHPRLGVTLPARVEAHSWTDFGTVMREPPDLLILGVASAGVGWAIDRIVESVSAPVPILMVTKGLTAGEDGIGLLPDLVAREVERRTGMAMPVMAIGGFNGSDPSPTLAQFQAYVEAGEIHYFIAGGGQMGGSQIGGNQIGDNQIGDNQIGDSGASSEIASWVAATFTATTVDGVTLYDLTAPTAS